MGILVGIVSYVFSQAKISYFYLSLLDEDVTRLEVSVDNSFGVYVLESVNDLREDEEHDFFGSLIETVVQIFIQGNAVAVLHLYVQSDQLVSVERASLVRVLLVCVKTQVHVHFAVRVVQGTINACFLLQPRSDVPYYVLMIQLQHGLNFPESRQIEYVVFLRDFYVDFLYSVELSFQVVDSSVNRAKRALADLLFVFENVIEFIVLEADLVWPRLVINEAFVQRDLLEEAFCHSFKDLVLLNDFELSIAD